MADSLSSVAVAAIVVVGVLIALVLLRSARDGWKSSSHRAPAREAPVQSDTQLRATLDHLLEGCQIIDRHWRYVYLNPAAARHGRSSVEQLVGRTMMAAYPGIEQTEMFAVLGRCMESGVRAEMENEFFHADGTSSWFQLVIHPVPEGLFILSLDITARKQAERELLQTHAQLKHLLEHSPGVTYALNVDEGEIVPRIVSDNIARLSGFSATETLTRAWWREHIHPDDLERVRASAQQAITTGSSRAEYRLRHKDGTYRWVEDHCRSVRDVGGRHVELFGTLTDITAQRRLSDELQASERRLDEMLNNLNLISMMLDRDANIIYCNDYLLKATGWEREEIMGRNWFDLFLPADIAEEIKEVFLLLLAGAPSAWHHENEIVTRSGERRLVRWNNSLLRSADGSVVGTASIGEDITDSTALQRQLIHAQRMGTIGTLASGIAHDLNNILMPIGMGVSILRTRDLDERAKHAVDLINRSIKRGADVIKQVLSFSRGVESPLTSVNLADVVAEVSSIVRSTFPKNIMLTISLSPNIDTVHGNATQLNQVLLNLCVNARDAMPKDGRILITASNVEIDAEMARREGVLAGSYVAVDVADTGIGMPKDVLDRVFDPFFTTKEAGTGLGLATVHSIVRRHRGFIAVRSEIGKGTTFTVYLPASPDNAAAGARAGELHSPSS